MAGCLRYEFQKRHFGFVDTTASAFYESQWSRHREPFVAYRAIMFAYCLAWAIYDTVFYLGMSNWYYVFLSDWGEWTLVAHFAIALGVSAYGLCKNSHDGLQDESTLCCPWNKCQNGDLRWFHHLSWVVSAATTSVAYVITIFYWSFLRNVPVYSTAVNTHQHIMNSVLVTIDVLVSNVPVRYLHFIYVSLYGAVYILFTLALHAAGIRSKIYANVLDWAAAPGVSAGVSIGLMTVGAFLIQLVPFGLYHLRKLIHTRRCTNDEIMERQSHTRRVVDDEEKNAGEQNNTATMTTTSEL